MLRYRIIVLLGIGLLGWAGSASHAQAPMPFQSPAVSRIQIAFTYAGKIWLVDRQGGAAHRLTTQEGTEGRPAFSPDGSQLAFWRDTGGNIDVYVASVATGEPKRLTYHPKDDNPLGWSADGKQILFTSGRASDSYSRLYTIPAQGGFETELPFPMAEEGAFSPDGTRIAYLPRWDSASRWRNYRGGTTTPIWIAALSDSRILEAVPRGNSNDMHPMWVGKSLYFTSDRTGTVNLFSYDSATHTVRQRTHYEKFDIRGVSACADALVFVREGGLHLLDPATDRVRDIPVSIQGDFPETKVRTIKAARWIRTFDLSPTGDQALFGARGEILTLDLRSGEGHNLTQSSGTAERSPAWSPDGRHIAYFSDESGEYQLHIRPADGKGPIRKIAIEPHPSYYGELTWSPDGRKLAFSDKRLALWYMDLDSATAHRIAVPPYPSQDPYAPAWSPDSRWLAYSNCLPNRLHALFVYSLAAEKSIPLTESHDDAEYPVFDKKGDYLYFLSSADAGPGKVFGMSSFPFSTLTTYSLQAIVLRKDGPSPIVPASSTRPAHPESVPFRIDTEGIGGRIVRLPVPLGNYVGLAAGKPGTLYLQEASWTPIQAERGTQTLYRYDQATGKREKWIEGLGGFAVSYDGSKLLYQGDRGFAVVSSDTPVKPGDGSLALDRLEITLNPQEEWKQIYHESWRIMRDYFYDPAHHGQDLAALERTYAAYLPGIVTRNDLNAVFREMFSHMGVSHMQTGGGDIPASRPTNVGLLGADYTVEHGRYRIARIYAGDNSHPLLTAPLVQPGVTVNVGDYLLGVDGQEIQAGVNLYSYFLGKAGKPTQLKVGPQPDGAQSRLVTVVPLPGENTLRRFDWVQSNRRTVTQLSGGKLGYIYLPDTGVEGYRAFLRDFYAQVDKQGLIVDERFNSGGAAADWIVETLRRAPLSYYAFREGGDFPFPMGVVNGPKVMLINEYAGSGGDTLPWMFRQAKIGPLVGMRTWGGGIGGYVPNPELLDGGRMLAPNRAFYNPQKGILDIENHGVAPDIEVELVPALWRNGHDAQLEKAVQVALQALHQNPPRPPKHPQYPVYP